MPSKSSGASQPCLCMDTIHDNTLLALIENAFFKFVKKSGRAVAPSTPVVPPALLLFSLLHKEISCLDNSK